MPAPWRSKPNGLMDLSLATCVRDHILTVLDECGNDNSWAAHELGVDIRTLTKLRDRITAGRSDLLYARPAREWK